MASKNILTRGQKRKGDDASIAGRLDDARDIFERVCRTDPLDVEAWVKLALVHKRLGDYSAAESCGRRAVALQPRLGFSHYALGTALHSQGRITEALDCYRTAVRLQPDFADTHYLLGMALHESGAPAESILSYRQALKLRPNFPDALGNFGATLIDIGQLDEAAVMLRRALFLQPGNVVALRNMSHVLRLQNKVDEALDLFRHALSLTPNSIEVLAGLVKLLEKIGNLEEARQLTERGLALAPDDPELTIVAAELARRDKRLDTAVGLLSQLHEKRPPPPIDARVQLLLGQTYDQMGDAERAYPLVAEGKRLMAIATLRSDADRLRYLDRVLMTSRMATEALATIPPPWDDSAGRPPPTFLIGFPRSGTTLLEQMLDCHPGLQTMEERGAVSHMVNRFHVLAGDRKDALVTLTPEEVNQLRQAYFDEVERNVKLRPDTQLIDKMPLNTVDVPAIWRVFPKAKFILAIRHPCDVCLSCLMQDFAAIEGMPSFFSLEETVRTYAAVMGAWRKYANLLPVDYHRVRYEELITDVVGETRKLLAFLDIEWTDAVLSHTEHARQRRTIDTPSYQQVTQPIYQDAKYRWKRYEQVFEPFMGTLQPFIEYFGY
jgi:tetratricopeptide (TPR) repeat protein